eukprot:m.254686 g.254686  ORF g.254686 m.254686 type:complete len:242 (+) comp15943_c1_seq7:159-884(+)
MDTGEASGASRDGSARPSISERLGRRTEELDGERGAPARDRKRPAEGEPGEAQTSTRNQDQPPARTSRPQRRSTDKVVKRNKRMFGLLNATLKTAAVKTGTQEKAEAKQKEVSRRLDEEKEEAEKQRREAKRAKIEAAMEADKEAVEAVQEEEKPKWDSHNRILAENFVMTKTTPHIFYLPAKSSSTTQALLDGSRETVHVFTMKRQAEALQRIEADRERRFSRVLQRQRQSSLDEGDAPS